MAKSLIVILLTVFIFVQCKSEKNENTQPKKEELTSDLTGIEVKVGMTLVGIVNDSETGLPLQGVVISDGYTSTETDTKGIYQLKRNTNGI